MKMNIPPLGSEIRLLKPWTFFLVLEKRNLTLFEYFGIDPENLSEKQKVTPKYWYSPSYNKGVTVTIPAGETLKFDRYYIRQDAEEFDSVTFKMDHKVKLHYEYWGSRINKRKRPIIKGVRFFAHLEFVNNIEFEFVEPNKSSSGV